MTTLASAAGLYNAPLRDNRAFSAVSANGSGVFSATAAHQASGALDAATIVDLSDEAISALKNARDASDALENLPKTLDELVALKTNEAAQKLTELFAKENIPIGEDGITLRFDASGDLVTDGPYKEKIEQLLEENPDLVEDLKTVDTLHTLRATAEALRAYQEDVKDAENEAERDAALTRFVTHSVNIQSVSGILTLTEDGLSTAASDYATAFFGSSAPGEEDVRSEDRQSAGSIA